MRNKACLNSTGSGCGCEVPTCNFPAGKQQKSSPLKGRAILDGRKLRT